MIPLDKNPLYACSSYLWDACMEAAEPKVAFDIGANDGGYTNTLLGHGFEVHAFEPVPDMFAKLDTRYRSDPRVVLNEAAVSDMSGSLKNVQVLVAWTIGRPEVQKMSVCPAYEDKAPFDVALVSVDDYVAEHGVVPGFIKLDVDGYEHKVLMGAQKTLRSRPIPILCEFSMYIERISGSAREFVKDILDLDYDVCSMDGKHFFSSWSAIEPCFPFDTSFDVMLVPRTLADSIPR